MGVIHLPKLDEGAIVRPATTVELQLVRDSWTKGATRGSKEMRPGGMRMVRFGADRGIARKALAAAHRLFVDEVLSYATVEVIAAEGEPAEALGWICYQAGKHAAALHWVWVRGAARRNGLGRALLEHARAAIPGAPYTHITPEGAQVLKAVGW